MKKNKQSADPLGRDIIVKVASEILALQMKGLISAKDSNSLLKPLHKMLVILNKQSKKPKK